ncbi:class C beta-lactamase-related serine hydrolase [Paenibacillus nanensis]|uniref:Class C beta-lactamase-related serine hydrolase n=1 Tax=Paenibacillus nanensis TaxID=393251 RepID=A0A3A1ULS1_9BACL|nr:serine hydrolase [Paenibacillus nanensis]RIX48632.1 class C beta-lactamase-related serine hydrolase [Paenibacillus nanensis]
MQPIICESNGLSSKALLALFEQIEERKLNMNSFILLKDGKTAAEFWREPYRRDCPQLLYSLSKSFTGIAVGIAWDQGVLDLQDKVISFFPDKLPERVSANLEKMTIHHLLSMNAGHDDNIYAAVAKEQDWVKAYLSMEVHHEPGTHYRYSTHSTYMLAAILERVTGQSLVDFLMPALFEPLRIERPVWETCPLGITAGGMGLSIRTEGIARFGQMLLNKGEYEGRRIVSERYIQLATTEHSDNRAAASPKRIDSAQGYGYQLHLCRRGAFRGDGSFGQLCFVAPKENIVIAATSSFSSMQQLQTLLDLIYEYVMDGTATTNERKPAAVPAVPLFLPIPEHAPTLHNKCYRLEDNPLQLAMLRFVQAQEGLELLHVYENGSEQRLPFSFTKQTSAPFRFTKDLADHLQEAVTYGAWEDADTLRLTIYFIETPYIVTYWVKMKDRSIDFRFQINVSLTLSDFQAAGHLAEQ